MIVNVDTGICGEEDAQGLHSLYDALTEGQFPSLQVLVFRAINILETAALDLEDVKNWKAMRSLFQETCRELKISFKEYPRSLDHQWADQFDP
jgi:hypothetical protein